MNKKESTNLFLAAILLAGWIVVLFIGVNYLMLISKTVFGIFIVSWLLISMYLIA